MIEKSFCQRAIRIRFRAGSFQIQRIFPISADRERSGYKVAGAAFSGEPVPRRQGEWYTSESRYTMVAVVQAVENGGGDKPAAAGRIYLPWNRRVSIQRQVRPDGIVILLDEFIQDSPQMLFVEKYHVIQAFPPDGSNDTLDIRILPRAFVGRPRNGDLPLISVPT